MPDPVDDAWLDRQEHALTTFARASVRPAGGYWWLDGAGRPDHGQPVHTWIACRMAYVFTLAHLRGEEGAGELADHGVAAIDGMLRDPEHGGWYASAGSGGPADETKAAYPHSFVVLALSAAALAGRPRAASLLPGALEVIDAHFWDAPAGRIRESFSRDFTREEPYRGANSSMHMVEAFLAAGDATGDPGWYDRALRIATHLIHEVAAGHDWRLPEHFTTAWEPVYEYNADTPDDPFRPYGTTIGHWLEWSRLLLHIEAALGVRAPAWLLGDATALFDAAVERGWAADGAEGFVYTLGWDDKPVVRTRMHWVVAEAIAAAAVLGARTGNPHYTELYQGFWRYARTYLVDDVRGSWHHELDPQNRPTSVTWAGKPDVYHAYQATLIPRLPIAPSLARAVLSAA